MVGVSFPECNFLNYVIKYRRLAHFWMFGQKGKTMEEWTEVSFD